MFEMRAKMIKVGLLGAAILLPIDLAKADQLGHASWYSLPANKTANGERMNPNELTAAHRSLPFGTRVLVENLSNGRSVVVRINDRGPFIGGRIIDLSKAAAASIGMLNSGTAKVRVTTTAAPIGGNAIAALGEATAKAKNGAALAAVAKVDITPSETSPKATAAVTSSKGKKVAVNTSSRLKHVAKAPHAKVKVASNSKRSRAAKSKDTHVRVAASTKGIHAVAKQASRLKAKPQMMVATAHPYAVLGSTPGFMKSERVKARRAG
jgi:rare lipoprotein A